MSRRAGAACCGGPVGEDSYGVDDGRRWWDECLVELATPESSPYPARREEGTE